MDDLGNWKETAKGSADEKPELGVSARAVVNRVIDGDTVEVDICWPVTIRLKDCWAPEIRGAERARGEVSKEALEAMLPVGSNCQVFVPTRNARKLGDVFTFGRVVGWVFRTIAGKDRTVSKLMVEQGFATRHKK